MEKNDYDDGGKQNIHFEAQTEVHEVDAINNVRENPTRQHIVDVRNDGHLKFDALHLHQAIDKSTEENGSQNPQALCEIDPIGSAITRTTSFTVV